MHLLIPAAGMGRRMGSDRNKLLLSLLDQPLLHWTIQAAEQAQSIRWIGIIGQPTDWSDIEPILTQAQLTKPWHWILGGDTRQESVYNGLQALPPEADRVLIHDGARCLATPDLFDRCSAALETCEGLIAAIPIKDTIKIVGSDGYIQSTPDRNHLWAAQTPQGFQVSTLKACHDRGRAEGLAVTDDAALFEHFGHGVKIVDGEETNLKITTPVDLTIAAFILSQRQS